MPKYPKTSPISLQQRLRRWIGRSVAIHASDLALEPGVLTTVFKSTFIIVQNERFVPKSTNYIVVYDIPRAGSYRSAGVRTTFDGEGMFDHIQLVKIGKDFIEVQRAEETRERIVIPINKVVGLFTV